MKIAIFSDIHGNKYSFLKALESMRSKNVQQYLFCGDICGYYYHQNEIIDIFRQIDNLKCILGNHDKMFLNIMDGKFKKSHYSSKYGKSLEKLAVSISEENLNFLRNLESEYSFIIDDLKIEMVHGTPWDNLNEYCYPDSDFSRYEHLEYDYIFQGHTHYRMYKKINDLMIVNPGSIGQPRDGKLPSYVLLDTSTKKLEFISIKYDIEELIYEINENNDPDYLIEVLKRSNKSEL
ncbi:metallophosphoesterase family protein [Aquibacillus albus]|uniref:Phosphoesterase n=1 Tax=Aquibacillus albus TaxID=1168171 RepID=A0ABS2N6E2_9BACI|nr:metallophosphoesterase family protein [Aquibacillus albus]MBM7573692.1 putative phosphoesterase [Aquibacillus albus]